MHQDVGQRAEEIHIGKWSSHLSLGSKIHQVLAPRWNEGDVGGQVRPDHGVHVLNLAGQAGHRHWVEVGVSDFQGGRDGEDYKGVLLIKCDFHHFDAIIIHEDRMWKQEENHQTRCQETEQDRQEDILLSSLRTQSLITVWDQSHQLIYLLCWNVACPLASETGDAISPSELHIWELSNGFFLLPFGQEVLSVICFSSLAGRGVSKGRMLGPHGRDVSLVSCPRMRRDK